LNLHSKRRRAPRTLVRIIKQEEGRRRGSANPNLEIVHVNVNVRSFVGGCLGVYTHKGAVRIYFTPNNPTPAYSTVIILAWIWVVKIRLFFLFLFHPGV